MKKLLCILLAALLCAGCSRGEPSAPEGGSSAAPPPAPPASASAVSAAGGSSGASGEAASDAAGQAPGPLRADSGSLESLVVALEASGLSRYAWEDYRDIDRADLAMYVFCRMQQEGTAPEFDGDGFCYVPADQFEAQAGRWFDGLPAGWLREGLNWYDPERDAYQCYDVLRFYNGEGLPELSVREEAANRIAVDYTLTDYDGTPLRENTLHLISSESGAPKLARQESVQADPMLWCVSMNLCGVDFDFEDPSQLTGEQLFRFAMWVLDAERLRYRDWEDWYEEGDWNARVPAAALREALALRLGEGYAFDPAGLEGYDAASDTVPSAIGGYGGVRDPALRERGEEDGVLTLTVDYRSDGQEGEPEVYDTRVYRLEIGPERGEWRLLSAGPAAK